VWEGVGGGYAGRPEGRREGRRQDSQAAIPLGWWVVVWGSARALVSVVREGASAVAARARCRATAYVANADGGSVSTIDVRTRTKNPTDITVGSGPFGLAVTPCRR